MLSWSNSFSMNKQFILVCSTEFHLGNNLWVKCRGITWLVDSFKRYFIKHVFVFMSGYITNHSHGIKWKKSVTKRYFYAIHHKCFIDSQSIVTAVALACVCACLCELWYSSHMLFVSCNKNATRKLGCTVVKRNYISFRIPHLPKPKRTMLKYIQQFFVYC